MHAPAPIELLAPARNSGFGKAAINHGADAVYIGYTRFGAREAAGNTLEEIESLIRYAHLFHARVYVTLNTILFDSELKEVETLIRHLYNAGADAIIIQDMGILEMDLPPIPLHASTQTHNFDLERIQFLERVGFSRVILARELSVEEISNIKQQTTIELEAFVHGALCVSFSGQCYLSHALTGRSANRGVCAQPCRSSYDLLDESGRVLEKGRHLLSLHDLNQTVNIEKMLDAGVTSFKIEGRLKDIDYVKNITAHYRKIIDRHLLNRPHLRKASSGRVEVPFRPDPQRSFNRGFTALFAEGRTSNTANLFTQKSVGQPLGTVERVGNDWFSLATSQPLANDDGLCFFSKEKQLVGVKVNRVEGNKVYPLSLNGIFKGALVYRNSDRAFGNLLKRSESVRFLSCELVFTWGKNNVTLTLTDEDGVETVTSQMLAMEPSINPERARQTLVSQLGKSGEYPFRITSVKITPSEPDVPFIPLSALNLLRRELFARHAINRTSSHPQIEKAILPGSFPYPTSQIDFRANVANHLAEKFYRRHGVQSIGKAFELRKPYEDEEVMSMRYCIRFELGYCDGKKRLPNSPKKLFLRDSRHTYPLHFDCIACRMSVRLPR